MLDGCVRAFLSIVAWPSRGGVEGWVPRELVVNQARPPRETNHSSLRVSAGLRPRAHGTFRVDSVPGHLQSRVSDPEGHQLVLSVRGEGSVGPGK